MENNNNDFLKLYGIVFVIIVGLFFFYNSTKIHFPPDSGLGDAWVLAVSEEKPLIVYFYSDQCGACQEFKPTIFDTANEYISFYKFLLVDTNNPKNNELQRVFKISGIPTVYLVNPKNHKYLKMLGGRDKDSLSKTLDKFLLDMKD